MRVVVNIPPERTEPERLLPKPPPLDDEQVFALTRSRWPEAIAVVRTPSSRADFRVSSKRPDHSFETESVERSKAIDLEGTLVGYSAGAKMIVVFR